MNICDKKNELVGFKSGHLYKVKYPVDSVKDHVYIYTSGSKMVNLLDGSDNTFFSSINAWVDVTDQYCLQKIK